jgi:hypothetical protein
MIWHSFGRAKAWNTSPNLRRAWPNSTLRRRLGARLIDGSYPQPLEPGERQVFKSYKDAGIRIDYHPQDAVAEVRDNFA